MLFLSIDFYYSRIEKSQVAHLLPPKYKKGKYLSITEMIQSIFLLLKTAGKNNRPLSQPFWPHGSLFEALVPVGSLKRLCTINGIKGPPPLKKFLLMHLYLLAISCQNGCDETCLFAFQFSAINLIRIKNIKFGKEQQIFIPNYLFWETSNHLLTLSNQVSLCS